ncbi:MAG: sigma-54-dependent Fis family transcriptional regulator, partial [Rhodocyclaceae bacterium]|nr:sigma-54-dependent Fis family transcriptional regulator [Rhodocyclaceae bacterium]
AFCRVKDQIVKLARVDAPVLITGESGTGKELAARAIHYFSQRGDHPFAPVNCAALAESLLESELFGHERGAFTDARNGTAGLVGEAAGGTLFLDEVDTLSAKAQAALLRFLQDRTYRRVGGGGLRRVDLRVVVACNGDLEAMANAKLFRRDLLYRLNVLNLHMPPLRERGEDGVELAEVFLERLAKQYCVPKKRLSPAGLHFIRGHDWPGNVREMENLIHREFLMNDADELDFSASLPALSPNARKSDGAPSDFRSAKVRAIAEFEQCYVSEVMNRANGNLTAAARLARTDRSAFGKLARKYGYAGKAQDAEN